MQESKSCTECLNLIIHLHIFIKITYPSSHSLCSSDPLEHLNPAAPQHPESPCFIKGLPQLFQLNSVCSIQYKYRQFIQERSSFTSHFAAVSRLYATVVSVKSDWFSSYSWINTHTWAKINSQSSVLLWLFQWFSRQDGNQIEHPCHQSLTNNYSQYH